MPDEFFDGKLELFLTCRALAGILRRSFPKDSRGRFMEEAALRALRRTHFTKMTYAEIMMMLDSLPHILALPYPIVEDIWQNCMNFTRQVMGDLRAASRWQSFVGMSNYLDLLMAFGSRFAQNRAKEDEKGNRE